MQTKKFTKKREIAMRMKADKTWSGMNEKQRRSSLKKTGSWEEEHHMPISKMGGSQEDVMTYEMREKRKNQYLKRVHSK